MRFKDFITDAETPFQRGFNAVDRALTPSKWGSPTASTSKKSSSIGALQLKIDRFELQDAQEIMSAVIKGNVSNLSSEQIQTAKKLLEKLNNL
jgi:hypothetical protein